MQFAMKKIANAIWNGLRNREKLQVPGTQAGSAVCTLYFYADTSYETMCKTCFVILVFHSFYFKNIICIPTAKISKQKERMATVLVFGFTDSKWKHWDGILRIPINFSLWPFGSSSSHCCEAKVRKCHFLVSLQVKQEKLWSLWATCGNY